MRRTVRMLDTSLPLQSRGCPCGGLFRCWIFPSPCRAGGGFYSSARKTRERVLNAASSLRIKTSAAAVHSAGCYSRDHECCQPGCQQYHSRHRIHHDQPVRRPVDLKDSLKQTAHCQRRDSGKPCIQSRPSREKVKTAVLPVPVLFIEGLRFFKINDLQAKA